MSKRNIAVELESYISLDYTKLDEAIETLQELRNKHKNDKPYLYICERYGDIYVTLKGERLESDEEYQRRLQNEADWKSRQIEAARKLLKEAGEI